jgi:hypothetical protein
MSVPVTSDEVIRRAIAERRVVRFALDGIVRVAEPHDYGVRNGKRQLLVFQVGGASGSGGLPDWRWIDLARASNFELLEQAFPGGRVAPSGRHARWDQLFARVEADTER